MNTSIGFRSVAGAALLAGAAGGVPSPAAAGLARADSAAAHDWPFAGCTHVVVPHSRSYALDPAGGEVRVEGVRAKVAIAEAVATTTLEISLSNPGPRAAEAVLLLPVPDGASVHAFDFEGSAAEPTAELLRHAEARAAYERIVARIQDPALLEFAGRELLRTSLFPVPAGGSQRVRLAYEELLPREGERTDYVLFRSESLASGVPWSIEIEVVGQVPVACAYSPSHPLETLEHARTRLLARTSPEAALQPGPFRLSVLRSTSDLSASLLTHPDPETGGGWFLLLAGLGAAAPETFGRIPREVSIVLDRSGSMGGEKIEQARRAAAQIVAGLSAQESFRIVDYADDVRSLSARSMAADADGKRAAEEYLRVIRSGGGTNIHAALLETLAVEPRGGSLPIVLFLTDGLPTVGETSELAIRRLVEERNPWGRRLFTLGVGHDVNVPLLDRLATASRAVSTYVLPGEDVESKTARVFERLHGPLLSDLQLEALDAGGEPGAGNVHDVLPEPLPDLFEGDRLVLLGRYSGGGALSFRLRGRRGSQPFEASFRFGEPADGASHSFVPRLWASRRIAALVDRIREASAQPQAPRAAPVDPWRDPYLAELAQEVLGLSTRFGVLSEYTAFLAREGTDLGDWRELEASCRSALEGLAAQTRTGQAAVNQGLNLGQMRAQECVNLSNRMWVDACEEVETSGVQQVADGALFRRGERWIESRLVGAGQELEPDEVVDMGSAEHARIVTELAAQGRQGVIAVDGEVLIEHAGRRVLLRNQQRYRQSAEPVSGSGVYR